MIKFLLTTVAVTFLFAPCAWNAFAEDAPAVNQANKTIVKKTIRVEIDADGNKTIKQQTLNDVKVQVNGNKVIIELPNGEKQTIDLPNENLGNFRAKAIIIGPDGKKHDIKLDGNEFSKLPFNIQPEARELPRRFRARARHGILQDLPFDIIDGHGEWKPAPISNFMIGIATGPASETLRAQLKLQGSAGLVVSNVFPETPAAAAGIKSHDVIVSAGDEILRNLHDLVEIISAAGEQDAELSITLIRQGKIQQVTMKPVKRERIIEIHAIEPRGERLHIQQFPGNEQALEKLEQRLQELEQRVKELQNK
jgi:hypothetical protein